MNSRRPTADTRTFIRVHDGIADHPKVEPLSDKAFRLLIETWAWCSRHRTDGKVPLATWRKRSTLKARTELLSSGLATMVGSFVEMHDYLDWQSSADEIAAGVAAKQQVSLFANHKRWHVDRGVVEAGCELCVPSGSQADPNRDPGGISQADPKSSPDTDTDTDKNNPPPPSGGVDDDGTLRLVHSSDPAKDAKRDADGGFEADFEQWWTAYPNSAGRQPAYTAYVKARQGKATRQNKKRKPVDAETLLEGARRYAAEMRRLGKSQEYIAHGATWLNNERWTDGVTAAPRNIETVRGPVFEGA